MENEIKTENATENVTENIEVSAESKPSKVKVVFFALWVVVAYLLIQGVIGAVGMVPAAMSALLEAGGDMNLYIELYMQKISAGNLVGNIQAIATIATTVIFGIWYFFGYVKKESTSEGKSAIKASICTKESIGFIVLGALAIYGLAVLIQTASSAIMPTINNAVDSILELAIGDAGIVGFITAVLLAPFSEEFCVRGIIVKKGKKTFGLIGCMILSAVFFAILHMNPIQGLYVLPMGLFWGYLAYRYNSVIPSIICHIINNLIGVSIGALGLSDNIIAVAIVMIIAAPLAFLCGKKVKFVE